MEKYLKDLIEMTDLTQNEPLKDIVYDSFKKAILSGVIPVGKTINQKFLSDYLNVSRTPIRIAIDRLKREKLLEETPHGVVVKRIMVSDIEEVFSIRLPLETIALTSAMNSMNEADFAEIEQLLHDTIDANNNNNVDKVIECTAEYSNLLLHHAHMPRLEIVIEQLKEYLIRFRDISMHSEERRTKAIFEHVLILDGMKAKDENLVQSILKEHLDASKAFIMTQIDEHLIPTPDLVTHKPVLKRQIA